MRHSIFNRFPLLILFYSILLWADTPTKGQSYEYFLKGEYALLQKNYPQAESDFSKALSLAPYSPTILQSLVDLKLYQGEYVDAIKYLQKIIELDPENKEPGLQLLQLYIQEEKFDEAHELLDILLDYHAGDIELLYARSNIQYLKQDWSNLLKTYHLIYLADPDNTEILIKIYEIGLATDRESIVLEILQAIYIKNQTILVLELLVELLTVMNNYSEAIIYIQKLMEIDEHTYERTINMGDLYLLNKEFDNVITTLEPMYKSENHSLKVLRLLLIAYSTIGNIVEQINISQILTKEYPELSIGYEALSLAYRDAGEDVNAINILNKALDKFPNEATFPYTLANIYYQSKNYIQAEKYFMIALDVDPQMFSILHTLAIMYEEMEDTMRSDSLFKHIIIQNKNNAIGLNDYAYIISERNNSSMYELNYALELAEMAIAIEPKNAAFLDTIGWIYYKMGTYKKAQEYLEKSLKINEDNPVILEHMGDIYHKLDASSQALLLYEQALKQDANNKLIQKKINNLNAK